MKKLSFLLSILSLAFLSSWTFTNDPDFEEILKKADFHRGGQVAGIAWDLSVVNIENGDQKNKLDLRVEATSTESQQFALISFLKPKKYSGQKLLLRGNNMWFIKKGMRRPIPISGRQRLSGSAANADVASANYYQDYNIINTTEATHNNIDCWVLELEAKSNIVSYPKLKYWISKNESYGLKAAFYGKSGKLIKTGFFEYGHKIIYKHKHYDYISKTTIFDNVNKEDKTIIDISTPRFESFSNSKFQKNSLLD